AVLLVHDGEDGPRVAQDEAGVVLLGVGIDRHQHRPVGDHTEEGEKVLRAVAEHDRYVLAPLNTAVEEASEALGQIQELAARDHDPVLVEKDWLVGQAPAMFVDKVDQGPRAALAPLGTRVAVGDLFQHVSYLVAEMVTGLTDAPPPDRG